MEIDGTRIGHDCLPYFIAEAGVNHNGDLDLAEELVDIAADAGADAVKFQTFSADRLVTEDASKAEYQEETTGEGEQYEMLQQYELDRAAHERLMTYAAERGITFLSTPFDPDSADMLADLGVPAIKIGSGELDNHPLLEHVAGLGLPMVVSTGMGTMEEVHAAHEVIRAVDSEIELTFLHCTSAYPAAVEDANLRAMQTMEEELPTPVGYSDHTTLPETPGLAVAAGACLVEKHFTVDSSLPGPDHEASLEPGELERAVAMMQTAATALGSSEKEPTAAELENVENTRRALHAAVEITEGTAIQADDVDILRPATGLSPRRYDSVIGARAATDIEPGESITASDVDGIAEGAE